MSCLKQRYSDESTFPFLEVWRKGEGVKKGVGLYYYGARYYDAQTSVWISVDPLAEKYPGISGFAYVDNNPLTYIDPNGKEIVLPAKLTAAQRTTILNTMQKLTNDKLYFDPKTNRIKIASLAKSGTETKVGGTRLIRRLNSSSKTITVDYQDSQGNFSSGGSGNKAKATNYTNAGNGTGSDAIVNFDPTSNPGIMTEDPKTGNISRKKGRPNKIGLGHELIHANHYIDGDWSKGSIKDSHSYKDASGKVVTQTYKKEELRTTGLAGNKKRDITENMLRKESKLNKRGAY